MALLELAGTSDGLLKYTDDNSVRTRVVIAHITGYARGGLGVIEIYTAKGDLRLQLDDKPAVTAAIQLLDGKF